MVASRWVLFAALAAVPACARSTPTPAPVPGNVAATAAVGAPLVPSFWDAHRRSSGSRRCTADDHRGLDRRSTPRAWADALAACWLDWQGDDGEPDPDGLAAQVAFATSLLDAGFPYDCLTELSPVITPYPSGLSSREVPAELEALAEEAMALGERCGAAADAQVAAFAAPTCLSDDACFALVTPDDDASDAALGDDEDTVVCPEVEQRTAGGVRRLSAADGPLSDSSFCCGVSSITTLARGGQRYLLVQPSGEDSMFIRVCGGGTASVTPAAIYRVDGDQLVLDTDRSLAWN